MRKTIIQLANEANGRSRACEKCYFRKYGSVEVCKVCRNAFMEGYLKGRKQAIYEIKKNRNENKN